MRVIRFEKLNDVNQIAPAANIGFANGYIKELPIVTLDDHVVAISVTEQDYPYWFGFYWGVLANPIQPPQV